MLNAETARHQVASATLASLIRIAGGGYAMPTSAFSEGGSNLCQSRWMEELKKLSYSCISLPNGAANNKSSEGKPHDVEVRAALMLFHRIRRGQHDGGERGKKNDNRKRKKRPNLHGSNDATKDPSNELEPILKEVVACEIISDLGTHREIDSIKSLANLLSLELEKELNSIQQNQNDQNSQLPNNERNSDKESNIQPPTSFTDIRPDDSGIICLVSTIRSKQLRAAGRIPCSHCINWFKGTKGLWWHQLSAHGINYSSATESAAGAVNSLAIVPFQEQCVSEPTEAHPEEEEEAGISSTDRSEEKSAAVECNAFDMVKLGKYDEFVNLIERGLRPDHHLDRNGASALHWAAGCGRLEFVSYLIEKCSCCPNQAQRGKRSFMGRTPLHWAARNGHLNVVEYLVTSCRVDIDAKTSDGTTAFCWASWQGHLEIMKFLRKNGCDIHVINSFGCNAVLWSAQGAGTSDSMAWLLESGSDFSLINSNGHSALHKAAQRGCSGTIKWLVNTFLFDKDRDGALLIGPDMERNCPSDLCGMEGHESLAQWISKQECDYILRSIPCIDHSFGNHSIPLWLQKDLHEATPKGISSYIGDTDIQWGAGCGVRRMALNLVGYSSKTTSNEVEKEPINDFNGID
ncbi:hypothetical protein ACHAXR_009102 [Thalassiosira sp. AJA248-18]